MSSYPAPGRFTPAPAADPPPGSRRSHALEGLTQILRNRKNLQILDFGGINQDNLDFVTGLGHKLYSEDLLRAFDLEIPQEEQDGGQVDFLRLTRFLEDTFRFKDGSADVGLFWDTLQFLPPHAAEAVLDQMHRVLRPDGLLVAFFHPDVRGRVHVPHACRIVDDRHLALKERSPRKAVQGFNPRTIERFFHKFSSVKFFLTRENMQEVLVKR